MAKAEQELIVDVAVTSFFLMIFGKWAKNKRKKKAAEKEAEQTQEA